MKWNGVGFTSLFLAILTFSIISTNGQFLGSVRCDLCMPAASCGHREADIVVVVHTLSSMTSYEFDQLKSLIRNIFDIFPIAECAAHAAILRYDDEVEEILNLSSPSTFEELDFALTRLKKVGNGTRTGKALTYVRDVILRESNGAQDPGVPKFVITLTQNESQDDVIVPSTNLRSDGVISFAVAIGETENHNDDEIFAIAGDPSRVFVFPSVSDFNGPMLETLQQGICFDINECLIDNGGCSHGCVDVFLSFRCNCPENLTLGADLRTCVDGIARILIDTCAIDNGGCCQVCTSVISGANCSCFDGYELDADQKSCSDTNECFDSPCSHNCVNTQGGFFCECPPDHEIAEDLLTCLPRPGPVDCPEGFVALSHSCMLVSEEAFNYTDAEAHCAMNGSRLVKIADHGTRALVTRVLGRSNWIGLSDPSNEDVWINSDGTMFTYDWSYGQPSGGRCGIVESLIRAEDCEEQHEAACEIPRETGLVIFHHMWPTGAQGRLFMPTDVNTVLLTFPTSIRTLHAWHGSVTEQLNTRQFVITQNDIERLSNTGFVGFNIYGQKERFPDYYVIVDPYEFF